MLFDGLYAPMTDYVGWVDADIEEASRVAGSGPQATRVRVQGARS